MNKKYEFISATAIIAVVGLAAAPFLASGLNLLQTAVADKGGNPDENAKSGPACDNANTRNEAFHDRQDTLGNFGQDRAHEQVSHNNRGLDFSNCL